MTTIAYKNGVIAYDSRVTRGDIIISDKYPKKYELQGVIFIVAGGTDAVTKIMDKYFGKDVQLPIDANAIVYDKGKLWYVGYSDGNIHPHLWKCPVNLNECMAFGSGQDHAFTAMDMGATAKEAVKMAMKRDIHTGGKIGTFKIKEFFIKKKGKKNAKKSK